MGQKTVVVNITGFANGIPVMDSRGNVSCNAGDWIQWNCPPSIGTITGITFASGSQVFSSGPDKMTGNSGSWKGQTSETLFNEPNPPLTKEEDYNITGNPRGGQTHSHDPKITVSPPTT